MPRTVKEILDHADALAERFERYEPAAGEERDASAFVSLREAVARRGEAERAIVAAVNSARDAGFSWEMIGSLLGTSGEAARQRYGAPQRA